MPGIACIPLVPKVIARVFWGVEEASKPMISVEILLVFGRMEIWFKNWWMFFSTYSSGSCFQSNFGKKIWVRQKIGSSFPPNFGGFFPSVGSVCRFPSIGWTKSPHPIHNSYSSMVNDPKSPAFRYKKIPIYLTWFQGISTSHSNTTMVPSGMFVLDGMSHSRCASESSQGKIKAAISTRTAIDGFYCFLLTGIFSQIVDDFVACPILVGGVFAFFCWYHLKCPN